MQVKVEGNVLTITVDISKEAFANAQPSQSGKTKVLASSHGFTNHSTPNGTVGVSLNCTTKS